MITTEEAAGPQMQEEPVEKKPRKKREKKVAEVAVEAVAPVMEEKAKVVEAPASDLDDKERLEVIGV
jgi:hypothetical protein